MKIQAPVILLKNQLSHIIHLGNGPIYSTRENGLISIVNIICFFSMVMLVITIFVDYIKHDYKGIFWESFSLAVFFIPIILNYKKKGDWAKLSIVAVVTILTSIYICVWDYSSEMRYFFILPIILTPVFVSIENKIKQLLPLAYITTVSYRLLEVL